jgi:peroxiredoxin
MQRDYSSSKFPLGSLLPDFELPNVAGNTIGKDFFHAAQAILVVFTCNHCPYVKGSEEMLIDVARKFEPEGLQVVTINSNDPKTYPEDSFDKMRHKSELMELPYPYLFDSSQEVAKAFDAQCTPECYLFDLSKRLVFHGPVNDNPKEPAAARENYLEAALVQLLNGKEPEPGFIRPVGCSIKWKR